MGAPRASSRIPFNITKHAREREGDPKSGNKKDKGKNGGSNNASSGSARTNSLLPPETGFGKGIRSRTHSASNSPTSSPHTSPETKKENLASGNKSRDSSAKQENLKPAALPTLDPPTPPASPETQSLTVLVTLDSSPAPSLIGNPSGLADKDKQDDVKSAALLSSSPLTPPASPEIRNLAVQADLENGPAPLNSPPENASGLAELEDKQDDVKLVALPTSDRLPHLLPPPCRRISRTIPTFSARNPKRLARQGHQDDVKSAVLPSSKSCHYY